MTMIKYLTLFALLLPVTSQAIEIKAPGYKIKTNKVIQIFGPIVEGVAESYLTQQSLSYEQPGDRVILINSEGGSVKEGEKIIHMMETEQRSGVKITCVVLGSAYSMAFNILTRCDRRYATARSFLLFHPVFIILRSGEYTARLLHNIANDLDADDRPFRDANAKALGLSDQEYYAYAIKDVYWRPSTLVEMKYLHGIVNYIK